MEKGNKSTFIFMSKRETKHWCAQQNIKLDLDKYILVRKNHQYYVLSRDLAKLDFSQLNIVHMGLAAERITQ